MEFGENNAIYLQIADQICENILLGRWKQGDRIPSVRELAVNLEVNPNTVLRTYTYLQDKGIIYNKRGIGYFITDDGYLKTKEVKKQDFINNELPRLIKAMKMLNLTMDDLDNYYRNFNVNSIS